MTYPRQSDIERAIRAAKKQGLPVTGVEIAPDGTIRTVTTPVKPAAEWERAWNAA